MRWRSAMVRFGVGVTSVGLVLSGSGSVHAAPAESRSSAVPPHQRPVLPLTQYVDPIIGGAMPAESGYAGNINPGAKVPFGFTHVGPDMPRTNYNGSGGYLTAVNPTREKVNFFSLTHLSGVGCPGQGTVGMMPASTPTSVSTSDGKPIGVNFRTSTEKAAPGYYKVDLDNRVGVELTATTRTGMTRFTYPDASSGYLSLDTRLNGASNSRSTAGKVSPDNVSLTLGQDGRSLSGRSVAPAFCTPWGTQFNSPVYFWAETDKPLKAQTPGSTVNTVTNGATVLQYDLTEGDPSLTMRIGISAVSVENAKLNLRTENASAGFDEVRADADKAWNARLNTVQVDRAAHPDTLSTTQRDDLVKLYSSLYRVFLGPTTYSDVNGDFRSMEAAKPYPTDVDTSGGVEERPGANVRDYTWTRPDGTTGTYSTHYTGFSMWDTYRSQAQLLALLAPKESAEMMQSLVVDAQQCGAFPHWVDASDDSTPMAGDNALPVLAGAYDFGVEDFDVVTAAKFVKQSAFDPTSTCNNRASFAGMTDYLKNTYYPEEASANIERFASDRAAAAFLDSVPQHVLDDPSVDVAQSDITGLYERANLWHNSFNADTDKLGARVKPTTPGTLGDWSTNPFFHESTEPNYFWSFGFAWSDLIAAVGGKDKAVERLNRLFSIDDSLTTVPTTKQLNGGQESDGFYIGNEIGHPAPWAYNWAGAPASTQYVVQQIMDKTFTTRRDGLPGNDDMGATSSWYVFAAMGMFPTVASEGGLALSTPQFPATTLWMGNQPLRITTAGDAASTPFIQSYTVGGQDQPSSWLPLRLIRRGTQLHATLGASASQWAAAEELTPPSGANGNYTRLTAKGDPRPQR